MGHLGRWFGVAVAAVAAAAWLWVAGYNWWVVVSARLRPAVKPPSMILLAGPVLTIVGIQALRAAGTETSGAAAATVAALGLVLDPGALPLLATAVIRRLRSGEPPH